MCASHVGPATVATVVTARCLPLQGAGTWRGMPTHLMRAFLQHQQEELASSDWLAAVTLILIRSISLAKVEGDEGVDHATQVEHIALVCLALYVLVSSLSRSAHYVRLRNWLALVLRWGATFRAKYVYVQPLMAHGGDGDGGGAWEGGGGAVFLLKLLMASRALPLALTSFTLPLPLLWVVLVQPVSLWAVARGNSQLCAASSLQEPGARAWFGEAAGILSVVTAVGAPGLRVREGRECEAVVLFMQLACGFILPLAFLVKGEAQRFVDFATVGNVRCTALYARAYQAAHEFMSGGDTRGVRWAALVALLAASWIVMAMGYS